MPFIFSNFVNTTLAGPLTSSSTTITLTSSANLPAITAGQVYPVVLLDAATRSVYEICWATAVSGASLTVTRAQEGTAAQAWLTGDYAYAPGATAATLASFTQQVPIRGNVASIAADGSASAFVSFGHTYTATPSVVATPVFSGNPGPNVPSLGVAIYSRTTTGFYVYVTGGTGTVSLDWQAVGQ